MTSYIVSLKTAACFFLTMSFVATVHCYDDGILHCMCYAFNLSVIISIVNRFIQERVRGRSM